MDINIQIASVFDKKNKLFGLSFQANPIVDGETLKQKTIKTKAQALKAGNINRANFLAKKELHRFLSDIKKTKKYDNINITIGSSQNDIYNENFIKVNQKDFNVKVISPELFNYQRTIIEQKIEEKIERDKKLKVENTSKEANDNVNNVNKINKEAENENIGKNKEKPRVESKNVIPEKEDIFNNLDSFVSRMNKNKTITDIMFESNVIKNRKLEEVFVNYSVTLDRERKRYGMGIEVYRRKEDLLQTKNSVYKQFFISKGERNETAERCIQFLELKLKKLIKANKKVNFNLLLNNGHLTSEIHKSFSNDPELSKIELMKERSMFTNKTEKLTKELISYDIKLHLERLKRPDTVAVWTDGSVNHETNVSGSGVLIRHEGQEEEIKCTNKKACNTHAEFRAVHMALEKIVSNDKYKNKKIIIVSDNDSIAHSIRNKELGFKNTNKPYLKEILSILNHFDLNIHFHNVKSHVYKKVQESQREELIDFHYNNEADRIAREAAGFSVETKKKRKPRIRKQA